MQSARVGYSLVSWIRRLRYQGTEKILQSGHSHREDFHCHRLKMIVVIESSSLLEERNAAISHGGNWLL